MLYNKEYHTCAICHEGEAQATIRAFNIYL